MPEVARALGQLHELEYISVRIDHCRDLHWHGPDPDRSHVALHRCARGLRGGDSGDDIGYTKDRVGYRVIGRTGLAARDEELGR